MIRKKILEQEADVGIEVGTGIGVNLAILSEIFAVLAPLVADLELGRCTFPCPKGTNTQAVRSE
ncbi:hypothetical protein KEM54_003057, partial [Ascosphaera aggregata]